MKVQGEAPKVPARERYGGARLAAAAMGAAAASAVAALHLRGAAEGVVTSEVHMGAAISGFFVGWRLIGLTFGRGWPWALFRGVSGGLVAAGTFCLLAGLHLAAKAMTGTRFRDAMEVIYFVLQRALDLAAVWTESPAMPWTIAAGIAVSLVAEALHLRWGWRGAAAVDGRDATSAGRRREETVARRR